MDTLYFLGLAVAKYVTSFSEILSFTFYCQFNKNLFVISDVANIDK